MRLEMGSFSVRDIELSNRTRYTEGILTVDREELRRLLLGGGEFADVAVEVARSGEAVRIIHVMDAVEPRYKVDGRSSFPGVVGPRRTAGDGRTHRLAGMAVVAVGEAVAGEPTYWREAIIDMVGPGAAATPFGATINLVLDFQPASEYLDADRPEAVVENLMIGSGLAQRYNRAVRVAELKAATYLARATAALEPDELAVYETAPIDGSLPRVVYFFQVDGLVIYGDSCNGILPSLIHPNEILDGALVNVVSNSHAAYRYSTFFNQNHGLVQELYAHHGQDLEFAGVIVYPAAADDMDKKQMVAECAVKLATRLGAHGVCSSYLGGGHPAVEFMLICQKCEQAGLKTVQVMPESYGGPEDPGFVYFVPEAVGIVSTGRCTERIELPAMPRVLGGQSFFDLQNAPAGPLSGTYRHLFGSCTSTGTGRVTARQR